VIEAKYFRPVQHVRSEKPISIGMRLLASTISGYGGRVPPPFSRFYIGGEQDVRGFDIRTVSPIAFYPTVGTVCNRDNTGNIIPAVDAAGHVVYTTDAFGNTVPQCGSSTKFPYNTPIFPGGDTEIVTNFEYRVPIAGPVTAAYFVDLGTAFVWRASQLKITPDALSQISTEFPNFPLPTELKPIGLTNFRPRGSTGIDVQVILPIVNAPFHIFWGYNFLRLNDLVTPPQTFPDRSLFPNEATYQDIFKYFAPLRLQERRSRIGFTVVRTF
jgi:outer membrane protein insertion porin family